MFGILSGLFSQKATATELLKQLSEEMASITGNQEYVIFTQKHDLNYWSKDQGAIGWVNYVGQGLQMNVSTVLQLRHEGRFRSFRSINHSILRFETDFFNIGCDFVTNQSIDPVYQGLLPRANPKKAIKLCNKFLTQAKKEGGDFKLCLGQKPYFMP